jgi:myo-inositol catabolism protein IolH
MLGARPIETVFHVAAETGYAWVELGNRDDLIGAFKPICAKSAALSRLRKSAADMGIEIASVAVIQAWSSPDEDARRRAVAWWRDGIAAAVELGAPDRTSLPASGRPAGACRASARSRPPARPRTEGSMAAEPHPGDFTETTAATDLSAHLSARMPPARIPHTHYLGSTAVSR